MASRSPRSLKFAQVQMQPGQSPEGGHCTTGPDLCCPEFGFVGNQGQTEGHAISLQAQCEEESDKLPVPRLLCHPLTRRDTHSLSG